MRSALLLLPILAGPASAQWVTIKGQVTLPAANAPAAPGDINVTADKEHCTSKGKLVDDSVIVDAKSRGLKNVWVYIRAANATPLPVAAINPALVKATAKNYTIDQPCCQFVPRILAVRDGDTLTVKNSAPVPHNIKYDGDLTSFNQTVPAGGEFKAPKPFEFQKAPVEFSCSIHPWMKGKVMIFDHPYFALTDADGKFEIKDVPAIALSITYRHENGYNNGKLGAKGEALNLAGKKDTVVLPPVAFKFP